MFDDILHIFYPRSYTLGNGKEVKEKFNPFPYLLILFIAIVIGLSVFTRVNLTALIKRGNNFFDIVRAMIPPNWDYWPTMEKAMLDTINMSLLGSVFGCAVALPVSFYLSSNFKLNKIYLVSHRLALSMLRTLPILVLAFFFRTVLGIGAMAGTLAISVFSYTICVKMMYEYIETLDMGAYEALESTGASRLKCILGAVWPQVKGFFLSTFLYCFETNVKSAAILGFVGAGGIGLNISGQLTLRRYGNLGLVLISMTVTIMVLEAVTRYARRKLVTG
ncbi:MAG: phosphonate ABC transporter, permease protein PhnE [Eubacteriales bacterium]|jgi:phosphonate transport system permease protein|nr:phosphonate ABC transporter, permease protein PhnE [Eubacteriales bacterium]MDD4134577.1 phosphonate ABC transporter, permease protein PhnE [Eubacteriales bacterium]NLO12995.1 phosphonate ABC transporter, permease protein PhnE [Clostridiales bacterium]